MNVSGSPRFRWVVLAGMALALAVLAVAGMGLAARDSAAGVAGHQVGQVVFTSDLPGALREQPVRRALVPEGAPAEPTVPPPGSVKPLLIPAYVPAGYTLNDDGVYAGPAGAFFSVTAPRFTGAGPHVWDVGDARIVEVAVRGHTGAFVDQAPLILAPKEAGGWALAGYMNLLVWDEDGKTFSIESNTLGQSELVKIAESLAAAK